MNKEELSWQDIQYLVNEIIRQLQASAWQPDLIIGVDRGGLVASVMISHYLGIPHNNVKVSLRDDKDVEHNCWLPELILEGKKILIVDDINDSGDTQRWLKNDWASSVAGVDPYFIDNHWHDSVRWASLVDNADSSEFSDFFGKTISKVDNPTWIDFPWESWWKRNTL